MQNINAHHELVALAAALRVRPDWHEPDEQDVSAIVVGDHLDNAMGSGVEHDHGEQQVILSVAGEPVACINLATLLAWAAAPIEARYQEVGTRGQVGLVATNGLELVRSQTRYGTRENLRRAIADAERSRKAATRG